MRTLAVAAAAAAAFLIGCSTITETPSQPTSTSAESVYVKIPNIPGGGTPKPSPTATPTPKPSPTATPTPGPTPTPQPTPTPKAGTCGDPLPKIDKINVKVHMRGPAHWTLDSTPQVFDREYCRKIGFTDGRTFCPVRPEGSPDRAACELYAVGRADDTNRPGPTWYYVDKAGKSSLCDENHCKNHPDNQYLLWITTIPGNYKACAESGLCGSVRAE